VTYMKLTAFGLSALIAGIAGVLYSYNFGSVSAGRFGALTALGLIAFAYVGGITMVSGAIFAGLISTEALFPHIFEKWVLPPDKVGTYTLLVGGLALILTLVGSPEGVAGTGWKKKQLQKKLEAAGVPRKQNRLVALVRSDKTQAASTGGER